MEMGLYIEGLTYAGVKKLSQVGRFFFKLRHFISFQLKIDAFGEQTKIWADKERGLFSATIASLDFGWAYIRGGGYMAWAYFQSFMVLYGMPYKGKCNHKDRNYAQVMSDTKSI